MGTLVAIIIVLVAAIIIALAVFFFRQLRKKTSTERNTASPEHALMPLSDEPVTGSVETSEGKSEFLENNPYCGTEKTSLLRNETNNESTESDREN